MKEALQHALTTARWVYPDQRIGQTLINALTVSRPDIKNEDIHSLLFHLSDDDLAAAIMTYASQGAANRLQRAG